MKILMWLALIFSPFASLHSKQSKNEAKDLLWGFAGKMSFDKDWKLDSYGWDYDEGKIKILKIGFNALTIPDLDRARKDVLDTTQELINFINSNEKNADIFVTFPISEQNLDVSMSYVNERGGHRMDGHICHAFMAESKLFYSKKGQKKLDHVHKETFKEALQLVNKKESQKFLKPPEKETSDKLSLKYIEN